MFFRFRKLEVYVEKDRVLQSHKLLDWIREGATIEAWIGSLHIVISKLG